jgi:hypothetical protein
MSAIAVRRNIKRQDVLARSWMRRPIGPLYPSGWLLLSVVGLGILYLFIDAETRTEVLPGVISSKWVAPSKRGISTDWLCTVTTSNNVQFETPCDAGTMLGTTTKVCRRTRIWSGIMTHAVGNC